MTIDYSTLPAPDVIEPLDYEALFARRKNRLIELYPEAERDAVRATLALESEPIVKLLQESAYEELMIRQRINDAARANLIQFATGGDLDALAAFYELQRLPGEPDERFRLRLQLTIAALAGNGTAEAYRARALGVSLDVLDATVSQPWPGQVAVTIRPADPAAADDLQAAVLAALTDPAVKILGVPVTVATARPHLVAVRARIQSSPRAPGDLLQQLHAAFTRAFSAAATMGGVVSVSWIMSRLHADGVATVQLSSPLQDVLLAADEYPVLAELDLHEGVQ